MKSKKLYYKAIWPGPGVASLANLTIAAASNAGALQTARRQAKKMGLPNTIFRLYGEKGNLIHHGL